MASIFQHTKQWLMNRAAIRKRRKADPEFKQSDDKRMAVEKAYQKQTFKKRWALTGGFAEEKSYTLKWRLNWAILIVGFLIADTFIILFFA